MFHFVGLLEKSTKYNVGGNITIQEIWLHGILTEFGIHTSPLVYIFFDRWSAIKISKDPIQ